MIVGRLRAMAPMAIAIAFAAAMFTLAPPHSLGAPWLLILLAVLALAWVALQPASSTRDDTMPALAIAIAALGVLLVARLSPDLAAKQLWLFLFLSCSRSPPVPRSRASACSRHTRTCGS